MQSLPSRPVKSHFSEREAAEELGLSIDDFRKLIRSHIVDRDEDLTNVPVATYQASDLVILRLLAQAGAGAFCPPPKES